MVFCASLCLLVNIFLNNHRSKYSSVVLKNVAKLQNWARLWLSRAVLPRQFMDDWRFAAWCRSLSSDASSSRLVHQDYAPRKHDEPHKSRGLCHLANSSLSPRSHYVALFSTLSSVFKVLLRPYQRTVGRLFVNHIYVSTKRVLSQHKLRPETWYYLKSGLFWLYTSFLATVLICPEEWSQDHRLILQGHPYVESV